jgi:hypothetical protein
MNYKIKILKETPFFNEGVIIDLTLFRHYFRIICEFKTDLGIVDSIKSNAEYSKFFRVIEENKYKVGDWVYCLSIDRVFIICDESIVGKNKWPNFILLETVEDELDNYKLANKEEIDNYTLHPYSEGNLLISKYKHYYYDNTISDWVTILHLYNNVKVYVEAYSKLSNYATLPINNLYETVSYMNKEWEYPCFLKGIGSGAINLTHAEVIDIAYKLNIIHAV